MMEHNADSFFGKLLPSSLTNVITDASIEILKVMIQVE